MSFEIAWRLDDDAWLQADLVRASEPPGSDYDVAGGPRVDLLQALVQISANGIDLFPPGGTAPDGGFTISLLDLALGLAEAARELEEGGDGARASFRHADEDLTFSFERSRGSVRIAVDLDRSPQLEVPEQEFSTGVRRFVDEVLGEIERRAPALLDWETLEPLRDAA